MVQVYKLWDKRYLLTPTNKKVRETRQTRSTPIQTRSSPFIAINIVYPIYVSKYYKKQRGLEEEEKSAQNWIHPYAKLTYCRVDSSERMFPSFPFDHFRIWTSIACTIWSFKITVLQEVVSNMFTVHVLYITWNSWGSLPSFRSLLSSFVTWFTCHISPSAPTSKKMQFITRSYTCGT